MYQYLRNMLNLADQVGYVDDVEMGVFLKDRERICISGKAKNGGKFVMELTIKLQEEEQHD